MNTLTSLFDKLTTIEQNNIMKSYLSDKIAGLIHSTLHDTFSNQEAKEEIESIMNSEITNSLSDSAKTHVLTMCDKALEIVQMSR